MKTEICVFLLFLIASTLIVGVIVGYHTGREICQEQAIEAGVAHYDTKTREFTWGAVESKVGDQR